MGDMIRIGAGYRPDRNKRSQQVQLRPQRGKQKSSPDDKIRDDYRVMRSALEELGIQTFDKEFRRLRKMSTANDEDFSAQKTAYSLLRAQLAMTITALPVLEDNLHRSKSDRAAYALVSLSSHMRELQHDLRAFGDQTELASRVREMTQSMLRELAASVVQDLIRLRQDLHSKLPKTMSGMVDDRLRVAQESLVTHFSKAEAEAARQVTTVMNIK